LLLVVEATATSKEISEVMSTHATSVLLLPFALLVLLHSFSATLVIDCPLFRV
jgi:hypothetical protein